MNPPDLAAARARIAANDAAIGAWTCLDPDPGGTDPGPLAQWPVGVKDLLDVRGLPTGAGAVAPGEAPVAATDAYAVGRLRQAGAAILGKTVAVEYGWFGTVTTRNPRDPRRSPGGSSSGSAAAVAAAMCRAALGTQTAGSVIRPAAFTGVPAVKFTHGAIDMRGVVATSPTLDSLGAFAADVADLTAVAEVLLGARATAPAEAPPRLGVIEDYFTTVVESKVRRRVERELERLAAAGVSVTTVTPNVDWFELAHAHRTIMLREVAGIHAERHRREPGHYSATLGAAIVSGTIVKDHEYAAALAVRDGVRQMFAAALAGYDAWVTAAAPTYAPPAGEPGDPACNVAFTLAGLPAVALPVPDETGQLPAALQLVGALDHDLDLLGVAARCAATSVPLAT